MYIHVRYHYMSLPITSFSFAKFYYFIIYGLEEFLSASPLIIGNAMYLFRIVTILWQPKSIMTFQFLLSVPVSGFYYVPNYLLKCTFSSLQIL